MLLDYHMNEVPQQDEAVEYDNVCESETRLKDAKTTTIQDSIS